MKNIVTVTGIRPDFVRMSEIFKKLDANFNHTLIHTGQHFDSMLSDIFFKELEIRKPDFNLKIGGPGKKHYHQSAELSVKLLDLFKSRSAQTDLIIFLGDSNSVLASVPLKKEGYRIAHIEAGMRSGDKRMLEEINRTVCDHCSDYHFVYHEHYKQNLISENLPAQNMFVVGNTIVEVFDKHFDVAWGTSKNEYIVLDIHRPENFKYKERLQNIIFMRYLEYQKIKLYGVVIILI
jgi:UDP-N-acetylglucosamine 2-epimerase (non-hydrolysing)